MQGEVKREPSESQESLSARAPEERENLPGTADSTKHSKASIRHPRLRRLAIGARIALAVGLGLALVAAYRGVEPFATYKTIVDEKLATLGELPAPTSPQAYPQTRHFAGTYRTNVPVLNVEQSITFKGDIVTMVDAFAGTTVFHYTATMQTQTEGTLDLEDVGNGTVSHVPVQYVPDADCLILYTQGRDRDGITYCR